uniref:Chemokine interleukin-8-like domain-containing protein n=1 Tax=Seriola dumerili TaxID=41447 RepID=A0A3B4TCV2_SERDU
MAAPRLSLSVLLYGYIHSSLFVGLRGTGPKEVLASASVRKAVPKERVVSYVRTSQRCPQPAVEEQWQGRQMCGKTFSPWVKGASLATWMPKYIPGETSNL